MTGLEAITAAGELLTLWQPGEAIPAADAQSALGILDRMIGLWAQQSGTIPVVARSVYATVAGKGSPSNPYTIGTGGDLNLPRPANASSLVGAGLLLNTSSPPVEMARTVVSQETYEAIAIKDLTSSLFTVVYYAPSYAVDRGALYLWPVPDNSVQSLVLYLMVALATFGDLTTNYTLPPGYADAIVTNLARKMALPFGRTADADLVDQAVSSLAVIKRSNTRMTDLSNAFPVRTPYNILTDTGG